MNFAKTSVNNRPRKPNGTDVFWSMFNQSSLSDDVAIIKGATRSSRLELVAVEFVLGHVIKGRQISPLVVFIVKTMQTVLNS